MEEGSQIFGVYCGKAVGKFFTYFCGFFCYLSFIVMLSGAGNTLNQQYGLPVAAGAAIMCALAVFTVLAGLNGVVEVIGKVGPVIVILVLAIAIITCIQNASSIGNNIASINSYVESGQIQKIGSNWAMSGLSYGGFVLLWFAPFMANLGSASNRNGEYREVVIGSVIGGIVFIIACWIGAIAIASRITETAGTAIPNLILAESIFPPLAIVFSVIIYAAIFSTACPLLYNASTTISKEGTSRYKIVCIAGALVALVIAMFLPYQDLVNVIYGLSGYVGAVLFFIMAFAGIRNAIKKDPR